MSFRTKIYVIVLLSVLMVIDYHFDIQKTCIQSLHIQTSVAHYSK